jgi:hypothetical protein
MPAPGKGPGSAGGTGGPGSLGGSGQGSPGGFGGNGNGVGFGKFGPYKPSKKKPDRVTAKTQVNSGSTIQTNEATASNLAQVAGTVAGALAGPVGTLLNAGAQSAMGVNPAQPFEKPTGTTDNFNSDPKNELGGQPPAVEKPTVVKPKPKKPKPLLPLGFQLLAGQPGTLLGT